MSGKSLGAAWRDAAKSFAASGIGEAHRDAQLLLMAAAGIDQTRLVLDADIALSNDVTVRFDAMIARRISGEPVARILGIKEFYGLAFQLGDATLVPRPETELLVDLGLEFCRTRAAPRILDLGTGTGAILIALLADLDFGRGVGVDISADALKVAHANAVRNGVEGRSEWLQGSWFQPIPDDERFDLIVSNPPYIASHIIASLQTEVREHDPLLALDGGTDGLDAYRQILACGGPYLEPDGLLLFEIGYDQGAAVRELSESAGFEHCRIVPDLGGRDRVIVARKTG